MGGKGDIPTSYDFDVALDPVKLAGGMDLDVAMTGDPAKPLSLKVDLDDINVDLDVDVKPLEIDLGLDDIGVKVEPLKIDLGLDDINVDLGLDNVNVCLSVGLTEVPEVQVHVPHRYDFGGSLFGLRIFNFTFGGESMFVTQDNPRRLMHAPAPAPRSGPAPPPPTRETAAEAIAVTVVRDGRAKG